MQQAGNGDREEAAVSRFAAAALTPSLRLDPRSFGAPARHLRASAVRQAAISIELRLSSVALARVRIAHCGRAVAVVTDQSRTWAGRRGRDRVKQAFVAIGRDAEQWFVNAAATGKTREATMLHQLWNFAM